MAFPKIGYRSILPACTLSGSVYSGFPLANLADYKVYTFAKAPSLSAVDWDADAGSNVSVDYLAVYSGNLVAENVTLTLKGDTTFPPTTVRATFTPAEYTTAGIWLEELGSLSLRYWRFSLSAASANPAMIGMIYLGQILTLTEFLAAGIDPSYETTEDAVERGETGHLLGSIQRCKRREFSLDLGEAGMEWSDMATANGINDFYKNHAGKMRPFFFHTNIAAPTFFDPLLMVKKPGAGFNRDVVGGRYARRRLVLPMVSAIAEAA